MLSKSCHNAFTLVETLVSLMIVGGILTLMLSGFDVSNQLQMQASFESEAALVAEREMEYLKSELIEGRIKAKSSASRRQGFFKASEGWQVAVSIGAPSSDNIVNISVETEKNKNKFVLKSYVYIPNSGAKK